MTQLNQKILDSILNHTPMGLNVFELVDADKLEFRYTYVNQKQCNITGFDLKQLIGLSLRDAFPPFYERGELLPKFCLKVLKQGKEIDYGEYEYGDKHIEQRRYLVKGIPLSETLVLVCTEDIEELRISQTELSETNKRLVDLNYRLEKITKTSPEIIYVYDLQNQQNVYANRSLISELGYSEEEVQQMGSQFFSLIVHPEDLPQVYAHHTNVLPQLADEDIVKLEYRMLHKESKEYVWLQSTESLFERDESGKVKTTIGIARNITQEKEAQQKLEQANTKLAIKVKQLSTLNEELNTFNYTVSHDLRQPVRSIHGLSQILQKKLGDTIGETEQSIFSEILKQTQNMDTLIHDLLKYAQIGNGSLDTDQVDMQRLCQDVYDSIKMNFNVKIEFNLAPIPPTRGDSTLLTSLWSNLLSNAIKYNSKERTLNIKVGTIDSQNDNSTTYFIKDNGIGFEDKYSEKVFKLFERLDMHSSVSGTGVGLSIAHKVVRKHSGKIWVESQLNKGTTFYFSLPIEQKNYD